jgi:hypothetical protein
LISFPGSNESFFTYAFYLLQELAGLARLASLIQLHTTGEGGSLRSPLIDSADSKVADLALSHKNRKRIRAHFPQLADVTERAEL